MVIIMSDNQVMLRKHESLNSRKRNLADLEVKALLKIFHAEFKFDFKHHFKTICSEVSGLESSFLLLKFLVSLLEKDFADHVGPCRYY